MTLPDLIPTDFARLLRLHAALLVVVAVVLAARVRSGRTSGAIAIAVVIGCLVWTPIASEIVAPSLPVSALNPIREGFGLHHLQEVTGRELDAGPLQDVLWAPLLGGPRGSLRHLVAAHLVLGGWAAILFAGLCASAIRWRPLAVALPIGAGLSAGWLTAVTSEIAATVSGFYLMLGAGLWRVADDREERLVTRVLAVVGLAGVGAALPFVRPEWAVLVVVAGLAGLGRRLLPGLDARLAGGARRVVTRSPWVVPTVVIAWIALTWWWGEFTPSAQPEPWRWALDALHPLNPHVLTLPIALLGVAPIGIALLAGRGFASSIVRPLSTAVLAIVVAVLYATMRVAAHGPIAMRQARAVAPWELYRYVLGLLPLVWLLALLGAVRWQDARLRRWLVIACLLPAIPEAASLLKLAHPAGWPRGFGFERASQVEVRALVARAEAAPTCGIVSPVRPWRGGRTAPPPTWAALRPARGGFEVVTSTLGPDVSAGDVVARLLPGVPCAVAWRGLDCAAVGGPSCTGLEGLPELRRIVVPDRPDVHPQHGVAHEPLLDLAWLAVPETPSSGR